MHAFELVNVPVYHVFCYLPSHAAPYFRKKMFCRNDTTLFVDEQRGTTVDILQGGTCQSANIATL